MVADDAQHVLGVALVVLEGTQLGGDLGRGGVGDTGHDGRERTGDGAAFVAVIGDARGHQQATDIGIAQA